MLTRNAKTEAIKVGDEVFWAGDMANEPERFVVVGDDGRNLELRSRTDGRVRPVPRALFSSPRWSTWADHVATRREKYAELVRSVDPGRLAAELAVFDANHAAWDALLEETPDWLEGELRDVVHSVSPRMSASAAAVQARYLELAAAARARFGVAR